MDAVFTFAVGFTTVRPVRPDQHTAFVTLAADDTPAGISDARHLAITWVHLKYDAEMVTSVQLIVATL